MVHGTREGIKVALAPLVTDAPILLAAWLVLSRLEGRSWALGIVALAGAVMLTRYAFDCFTPPPPETAGSGRAPHSLGGGSWPTSSTPIPICSGSPWACPCCLMPRVWGCWPSSRS